MPNVYCDRHRGLVEGDESEHMTAGFYRRSGWSEFFNDHEERVCDECMWADARYVKVYGRRTTVPNVVTTASK